MSHSLDLIVLIQATLGSTAATRISWERPAALGAEAKTHIANQEFLRAARVAKASGDLSFFHYWGSLPPACCACGNTV